MPRPQCCGTSVGVIIADPAENVLMITRGWFPVGVAPVAGHVADAHTDAAAAAVAETQEETGLTLTAQRTLWRGWLPNLCASPPAAPVPGHHWTLVAATAVGDLTPDPTETRGAAWYAPAEVSALAQRTLAHAYGEVGAEEFAAAPGLEPVWVEHLATAGRLEISESDRAMVRRLYTTPPDTYWTGERLVGAAELAAEGAAAAE